MESLKSLLFKALIFLGLAILFIACKKEQPTLVKIRIIDESEQVVSGAEVILDAAPNPPSGQLIMADTAYTNAEGWAFFDYSEDFNLGTSGFRLVDIMAKKDGLVGSGMIKIIEEEVNVTSLTIALP